MPSSWVEAVGGDAVVSVAAAECGVELGDAQRALLERFGTLVEAIVLGRAVGSAQSTQVTRAVRELDAVGCAVRDEVNDVVRLLRETNGEAVCSVVVEESLDTGLPVVRVNVVGAPELVVRVGRSYCEKATGVSYGFRSDGGRLQGAAAAAAGRLDESCREIGWQVSVSRVITSWVTSAMEMSAYDAAHLATDALMAAVPNGGSNGEMNDQEAIEPGISSTLQSEASRLPGMEVSALE
jgi:hypothetical protein